MTPGRGPDDDEPRDAARERLEFLDAMLVAIERRAEVMELIASSASADDARAGLAELLAVPSHCAVAILDLQWRRLAQRERTLMAVERDRLRAELDPPSRGWGAAT